MEELYDAKDPNDSLTMFYQIYNAEYDQALPLVRLSQNRNEKTENRSQMF